MGIGITCQVCDLNEAKGVASSTLAPMSIAFCQECLDHNAEPLWILHATLDLCGGPDAIAEWVKELQSFKEGQYIDWKGILACYKPDPEFFNDRKEQENG